MKKATTVLSCILFAFIILFPAGVVVSACFGYTFELINVLAFSIVIAVLSVCTAIFSLVHKETVNNKPICVLIAALAPLSLINLAFHLFACRRASVVVCTVVTVGCCCYLAVKHGKTVAFKITALILSALMIVPIAFFCFIALIFGNFGQTTVVQTIESPNGKYVAKVIDSDQGALGGDTLVDVYQKGGLKTFLFEIEKKPQMVYFGDWGEFENMEIYWKNDNCLVINSVEYEIE